MGCSLIRMPVGENLKGRGEREGGERDLECSLKESSRREIAIEAQKRGGRRKGPWPLLS